MSFANMKVGMRLGGGFALVLALLVAVTLLGLSRMGQIQAGLNEILQVNNVEADAATALRLTVIDRMVAVRNLALLSDAAEMQPEAERIKVQERKYAAAEDKLNKMFSTLAGTTAEEKAMMPKIKAAETAVLPLIAKAAELGLANKPEEVTRLLMKEIRPLQTKWIESLNDLIALEEKLNAQAADDAENAYANARTLMLGLAALAVASGVLIAWLVTRSITGPLNQAVKVAQTVAAGDLGSQIDVKTTDETGQLLLALKGMNDSLVRIVGEVRIGTDTIATASSQIASGNLDLSSRTEQQASSLEETASSMEELTSTVKQNADNARQANGLAQSASAVAVKGGAVVSQVVETMGSINDSAKKIADIIGVIDGIAFQTNILALNAAVEAARAGEQGRGFAVVASEVRNLAQRSAAAAKEIKGLIGDSVAKVEDGSKLVDQAGATMQEIVDSVRRVTDIMSEITAASVEQSAGIEQVNQAITEMDAVTQQNAALVEEAAAAAESLQGQAEHLTQVVGVFKIGAATAAVAAPAPVASRPTLVAVPVKAARSKAKPPAVGVKPKLVANASGSDSESGRLHEASGRSEQALEILLVNS
jgi:methyl-accepting chemotaxis protein